MNLSTLTNTELGTALENLTGHERSTTLKVLYHLIEIEKRRMFEEAGFPSLFEYCRRKLNYSEGSAIRRISGARCLKEHPELAEMFQAGKVTLCSIATASKWLKANLMKLEEIAGKSQREVQRVVALTQPVTVKPKERVRPIAVDTKQELPLLYAETAPKEVEERYELRFSVSKEVYERFEAAKAKLSNALGRELGLEAVFSKLLEQCLKPVTPRGVKRTDKDSRRIPASVKQEVHARDDGQCTFKAPDGTRCCERLHLQIDHITPFACGGRSELSNLRLLCSAHNRLLATRYFGKEKIQSYFQR